MTIAIAASTIVQQAFRLMGLRPPASFGDESEQAVSAAEAYDQALAVCLEVTDWSFASVIASLPLVASDVHIDPDLPHAFVLPADTLMLRAVIAGATRWRSDRSHLRTDSRGPVTIRYTARITNELALPGTFQYAVALQLAVMLAPRWVEVQSRQDRLEGQLREALTMASRQDARTASPLYWGDGMGDWVSEARL